MTTVQLLNSLELEAVIDHQAAAQTRQILASFEHGDPLGPDNLGQVLSFRRYCGFVSRWRRHARLPPAIGRQFFVHPSTITEMEQLIRTETETGRLLESYPDYAPGFATA